MNDGGGPAPAATRVRQAANPASPPDTLQQLATDPDVLVRAAVAINAACGSEVTALLAEDEDERVRALLGARVARLLPGLDEAARDSAADHVKRTLSTLARDRAFRVRAAIADEVKSMAAAPRDLVLHLARDEAAVVSDPVIRMSPVLTDADLLSLLATPPFPAAAAAIASRPTVSRVVCDVIASFAEGPAIRALLANQSACIQESTLDALVGRAPDYPDWHSPLVQRPCLSRTAIRAMSEFVAADLLQTLAARTDLDPAALAELRDHLGRDADVSADQRLVAEGTRLKAGNALDEAAVLAAASGGNKRKTVALLAVAGGVSLDTLQRMIDMRSAKALVSFVWSCGFSMETAVAVQALLLPLAPETQLRAGAAGGFPLEEAQMTWQLELMATQADASPEQALPSPAAKGQSAMVQSAMVQSAMVHQSGSGHPFCQPA